MSTNNCSENQHFREGSLQKGRESEKEYLASLYKANRDSFINWAKFNFSLNDDEVKDIYQDTIIGFYKNLVAGKVDELNYSTKTYLFAIGKNLILNRIKRNKRLESTDNEFDEIAHPNPIDFNDIKEEAKKFIDKKISDLGEPCRSIIRLYYYHGYSLEAIRREVKSKNPNVVKAQKARCMKALKSVFEKFKMEDFF